MKRLPRMTGMLLVSLALLALIMALAPQQIGVSLYKLSLITTAAWAGYWIDRSLFPYARPDAYACSHCNDVRLAAAMLRRAVIVGCAMLAVGMGA